MNRKEQRLAILGEYISTALIKLEFTDFTAEEINEYLNETPSEDTVTVELDKPNDGEWNIHIHLKSGVDGPVGPGP